METVNYVACALVPMLVSVPVVGAIAMNPSTEGQVVDLCDQIKQITGVKVCADAVVGPEGPVGRMNQTENMTAGPQGVAGPTLSNFTFIDVNETAGVLTPPNNVLRLYVEDFKGLSFFSFKDDTGMVRKIVRDSVFVGKNVGAPIPAYAAVYATTVGDGEGTPTLGLALASSAATMPAVGITIEPIATGAFGRVMQVGLLENVPTNFWNVKDVLYVSSTIPGFYQTTAPVWPNLRQEMGTVLVSDPAVGQVQVIARSAFNDAVINHAGLLNLDYASSGHTGFAASTDLNQYVNLTNGTYLSQYDTISNRTLNIINNTYDTIANRTANIINISYEFPAWAAWTPTLTYFGGTPSGVTGVYRNTTYGKTEYFILRWDATNSSGITNLQVSLPVPLAASGATVFFTGGENNALSAGWIQPLPYSTSGSSTLGFQNFTPMFIGQPGYIRVSGFYEVT